MPISLSEPVKTAIRVLLTVVYPLWQARPTLDQRRTLERLKDRTGFSMNLRPHKGARSQGNFTESLKDHAAINAFEQALSAMHPSLLDHIETPLGYWKIDGVRSWINPWCMYIDQRISTMTLPMAIADLLKELDAVLASGGEYVTTTTLKAAREGGHSTRGFGLRVLRLRVGLRMG